MNFVPMDEEQVRALLVVAMAYDHRKPGQADVTAWLAAAQLGRWRFGEARDAVVQHYTLETEFLKPGHITKILKARRQQPARVDEVRQIEAAPPAAVARVKAAVAEVSRSLGWAKRPMSASDRELRVACPWDHCRAGVGRPCGHRVTRGSHAGEWRPLVGYHDSRVQAASRIPSDGVA